MAHVILHSRGLLATIAWLITAIPLAVLVYWFLVRARNRPLDARIPNTMMVLGATVFLSFGSLLMLWFVRERIELSIDAKLSIDTLAHVAAIAISATGIVFTYIMKSDQSVQAARQQIYQTLELQSIELFRFEAENAEIVSMLWGPERAPTDALDRYQVKQYTCQMLNLFEMAYRFRAERIMDPAVFGSWVIWIWELCSTPVFQALWSSNEDNLPLNYVPEFRKSIEYAIDFSRNGRGNDVEKRKAFFEWLGKEINCIEIPKWLDQGAIDRIPKR